MSADIQATETTAVVDAGQEAQSANIRDMAASLLGELDSSEASAPAPAAAPPAEVPAESPAAAPSAPSRDEEIAKAIAAREEEQARLQKLRSQWEQQERRRIAEEVREAIRNEVRSEYRERLRADPQASVADLYGDDPARFLQAVANPQDPALLAQRKAETLEQKLQRMESLLEQQERQRVAADQARVANAFAEQVGVPDKRPTLAHLLRTPLGPQLIAQARDEANRRQELTGAPPSWEELGDWLESMYRPQSTAAQQPAAAPAPNASSGTRVRVPTQSQTAERRAPSSSRPAYQLSDAERRQLAVEAIAEVEREAKAAG